MAIKIKFVTPKITDDELEFTEYSKVLGLVCLPENWFEEDIFGMSEMFVCQVNICDILKAIDGNKSDFALDSFSQDGTLYFFIDTDKKPYRAVVRYSENGGEACTDFNDGLEISGCDKEFILEMNYQANDTLQKNDSYLFKCSDNKIELLSLNVSKTGLDCLDKIEKITYVIDKKDFAEHNFDNVKLDIA